MLFYRFVMIYLEHTDVKLTPCILVKKIFFVVYVLMAMEVVPWINENALSARVTEGL